MNVIAVGISSRAAFYLFVVTQESAPFSRKFVKDATFARVDQLLSEQIFHYKHFCEVILAYRVVYF